MNKQLSELKKIFEHKKSDINIHIQNNFSTNSLILNFLSTTKASGTSTFIFNLFYLFSQIHGKKILLVDITGQDYFSSFYNNHKDSISFISDNIDVDFLNTTKFKSPQQSIEKVMEISNKNIYDLIVVNSDRFSPISFLNFSHYNFLTCSLDPESIAQCNSALEALSNTVTTNFGLFITNIAESQFSSAFLEALYTDILLKHHNVKLCGHAYHHNILKLANERKKTVFVDLNQIDETAIYKEYLNNITKLTEFISTESNWLQRIKQ